MGLIKREYTDLETVISAENLNAIQDAVIALEDGLFSVDNNKSGEVVTITDATRRAFRSISIYGKTTQNGTPTPDAPVELVNIGSSGSITVSVTGEDVNSMTIATPNGLPGIPVAESGNYTDANGQQWVCDEIDFGRGVYVKRINIVGFENAIGAREKKPASGDTYRFSFYLHENPTYLPSANPYGMCNALVYSSEPIDLNKLDNAIVAYYNGGIFARCDAHKTVGEFVAWAKNIGLKVQYALATPIETPLSAEELAAFSALHTYRGNTVVSNDAGAYMDLEYVMDAKKYIASMVGQGGSAGRIVSVSLPASAWKGSGTLYSQVVSIPGVTENSQVNLTPSVEQLSIFYDKDITFVTENDGGVVTIYVIGQKPQNDYTIPANIVEVIV